MRQYYYTVAALPNVQLEHTPFFSEESFLEHCGSFLLADDMAYVRSASIAPRAVSDEVPASHVGVLGVWRNFVDSVYAQGATLRAHELGWEIAIPEVEIDPARAERVRQYLSEDSPLKMELALLRGMWNVLEELEIGRYFDREVIALYYLKLQLALRYQRITDTEAGRAEFDRQYDELSKVLMEIDT